ncbi:hypothetical protein J3E73DRAFT_411989 [Bipolaris maydis]|nr:hypothetical protein J3E73DRAFT_411989 [Bipolaris maydis]
MHWLPADNEGNISFQELQLDIVGFLAILGEGSVLANAQVSTLSRWIFLPRLLPAPQALMRPTRPSNLEPFPGFVTGIVSGNHRDYINHIGNIVCDANNLPDFCVRVVHIKRVGDQPLKSKTFGPLTVVLLIGFALSVLLLAFSIWQDDGMSIIATLMLSALSRQLLVVRCEEDVARELYFAPEGIHYLITHAPVYRLLSLIGTMVLMGGVICLANAQIQVQIAWAGSYMLLNASYWIVAALPSKMHWDTSCYQVIPECLTGSEMDKKGFPSPSKSYTEALWKTICVTKDTDWVRKSSACPDTKAWDEWLREAKACSQDVRLVDDKEISKGEIMWEVPVWDPHGSLTRLMEDQANGEHKMFDAV